MRVCGNASRSQAAAAPRCPLVYGQLEGAGQGKSLLEGEEARLLRCSVGIVADAQPVRVALPPSVFVDFVGGRGDGTRALAAFAPLHPFFAGFKVERPSIREGPPERQERVLPGQDVASSEPVAPSLPAGALVRCVGVGRDVRRSFSKPAPCFPLLLLL